jgi:hypothetical protein
MVDVGRLGAVEQQPDLLAALRRQWVTIVVAALLGTAIGWVFAEARQTVFESRATLLLSAAGNEVAPSGGRNRTVDVDTWATVARSTVLLQEVANDLGRELADVRSRTTAAPAATGDVIVLTFEAADAETAVEGAAAYAQQFLANREIAVNRSSLERVRQLENLRGDLETQVQQVSVLIEVEEAKGDNASQNQLSLLTATQEQAVSLLAGINTDIATIDTDAETGRVLIDPSTAVSRTGLSRSLTTLAGLFVGALIGLIAALLRDRYDDRYASVADPSRLGIREVARVPYPRAGHIERTDTDHAYSRLITRLTFSRRGASATGRSVLILPVDSRTLPGDASTSLAAALEASADVTGILVDVWNDDIDATARPGHWAEIIDEVEAMREQNDLVLVPVRGLDRSAAGIGLASLVDDTVLLVAEATPMNRVLEALDDLRAVAAQDVQVLVVSDVRRRRTSLPARADRSASGVEAEDQADLETHAEAEPGLVTAVETAPRSSTS